MKRTIPLLLLTLVGCATPPAPGSCLPLNAKQAELCTQGSDCIAIHKDIFVHNLQIELEAALRRGYEAGHDAGRAETCKGT